MEQLRVEHDDTSTPWEKQQFDATTKQTNCLRFEHNLSMLGSFILKILSIGMTEIGLQCELLSTILLKKRCFVALFPVFVLIVFCFVLYFSFSICCVSYACGNERRNGRWTAGQHPSACPRVGADTAIIEKGETESVTWATCRGVTNVHVQPHTVVLAFSLLGATAGYGLYFPAASTPSTPSLFYVDRIRTFKVRPVTQLGFRNVFLWSLIVLFHQIGFAFTCERS